MKLIVKKSVRSKKGNFTTRLAIVNKVQGLMLQRSVFCKSEKLMKKGLKIEIPDNQVEIQLSKEGYAWLVAK